MVVSGGNAGNGTNANIQMMALAGTAAAPSSSVIINELSTAGGMTAAANFGLLNDSSGTITVTAPANAASLSNLITQHGNLIFNGQLNTNTSLSTAMQNGLNTIANALASCIENSSNCSSLMSAATGSSGASAANVLEAAYNMLNNSSTVASGVYTIAASMSASTGFTIPASKPGGFTFNNALAATSTSASGILGGTVANPSSDIAVDASGNIWIGTAGTGCCPGPGILNEVSQSLTNLGTFNLSGNSTVSAVAIDASGNLWLGNINSNAVFEFTSTGAAAAGSPFSIGSPPNGLAIDASGNIWITSEGNSSNVVELNSSGTTLGTFALTGAPAGIAIDALGKVWVNNSNGTLYQLSSSGGVLGTTAIASGYGNVQIDQSGNPWIRTAGATKVVKVSSSGTVLGTFSTPTLTACCGYGEAIDSCGNVWVTGQDSHNVAELSSSGTVLATYSSSLQTQGLAIDASGNVWIAGGNSTSLQKISGVACGPQFFPYSGPIWPVGGF